MDDPPPKHRVLTLLNALREASGDLRSKTNPFTSNTDSIDALLNLETKAAAIFSTDPNLRSLSHSLSALRALIEKLDKCQGYNPRSLLCRQITTYKISEAACAVESEIQAYVDRIAVQDLVAALQEPRGGEDEQVHALVDFQQRLSRGFDLNFQDLVLRAKVFTLLERTLFEPLSSRRVKEEAAEAIAALVRFNKNVFVGLVLMGPTIKALIAMGSSCSMKVLTSLVSFIRSPLVDEILSHGEIPTIVGFLSPSRRDWALCAAALDCVLEIAYIGRMEVVEAMFQEDVVKRLMELQRRGSSESDVEEIRGRENGEEFDSVFGSCVSRFGIQLEVGEGLSSEEKTEVKLEILKMVKEASETEAEYATVSAEILWGSSP